MICPPTAIPARALVLACKLHPVPTRVPVQDRGRTLASGSLQAKVGLEVEKKEMPSLSARDQAPVRLQVPVQHRGPRLACEGCLVRVEATVKVRVMAMERSTATAMALALAMAKVMPPLAARASRVAEALLAAAAARWAPGLMAAHPG